MENLETQIQENEQLKNRARKEMVISGVVGIVALAIPETVPQQAVGVVSAGFAIDSMRNAYLYIRNSRQYSRTPHQPERQQ